MGYHLVMNVSVRTHLLIIRFSFSYYVWLLAEIMGQNSITWVIPLIVILFWKVFFFFFFLSYGEEPGGSKGRRGGNILNETDFNYRPEKTRAGLTGANSCG